MDSKKIMIGIFSLFIVAMFITGCSNGPTGQVTTDSNTQIVTHTQTPIKIGFISPLSGDAASFGNTELDATMIAIDEINAKGGIDGRLIELIPEDGKCNGRDAANAAQKLINVDKVKVILGGACSGETLAIAPITEANKVILFAAFSSSPKISDAGDYVFRNCPTDNDWAPVMAEELTKQGYKRVAVITENTDYAQGVREIFKKKYLELGGTIVADEVYGQGSKDFRTQLLKVKDGNPDAIFINPQDDTSGGLLVKQLRELNVNTQLYGAFFFSSPKALELAGTAVNGAIFFDMKNLESAQGKELLVKYTAEKGTPASEYVVGANYDRAYILKGALEKCGEDADCIKNYLYSLKDFEGVTGTYGFNDKGDIDTVSLSKKQVVDGKIVVLE